MARKAPTNKGLFGSCKSIFEKENVFRCLRKINSGVWFVQTFYGKSIPMFGLVKHFMKNGIHFFTKNQFSFLVCESFYGK